MPIKMQQGSASAGKQPGKTHSGIQKKPRTANKRLPRGGGSDDNDASEVEANQNNMLMKPMKSNFEEFIR